MTRRAEIIAIGSELLTGIQETNSSFIAERLALLGIDLRSISIVSDREEEIAAALKKALERSDLVVLTGGLGPTEDDLTKKTISKLLAKRLVLDEEILDRIKAHFKERNREMPKSHHRQALIPFGAKPIDNRMGTAPGFSIEHQKSLILCLPGPTKEMKTMFLSIEPLLKDKYRGKGFKKLSVIRTVGLHESYVNEKLKDIMNQRDNGSEIGIVASEFGIDIRITLEGPREEDILNSMGVVEEKIRERLGDYIYGTGEESLEGVIGRLLRKRGVKISIAESCTGGIISHRITNIPNSSDYFERGVVCYSNKSKVDILDVPSRLIEEYGSVSKEVAIAMAEGIRSISGTDIGLSTTGIAGPTGGREGKPIGLVYIALADPKGTEYKEYRFISDREGIKTQASQMALDMLRRYLIKL
jgi:nicotinamide-nucleotide amidase